MRGGGPTPALPNLWDLMSQDTPTSGRSLAGPEKQGMLRPLELKTRPQVTPPPEARSGLEVLAPCTSGAEALTPPWLHLEMGPRKGPGERRGQG